MPLHVVTTGSGPRVVFVHGSAADHATWTIQLASAPLRARFALVAYDRRADPGLTIEDHAADLAALIGDDPAIAVGSSFGAVCVLEAMRAGAAISRAVLCEPPLPPSDDAPGVPDTFLDTLDALAANDSGEAAAERFLRTVLGDAAYEKMPRMFQVRAKAMWPQIRSDCGALVAYRVRYAELGAIRTPTLLLGGDRSAPYFRPTLDALAAHLGAAERATLTGAGHMMHADAHRQFAERLLAFGLATAPG